ncbi:DUF4083 domain-containing protein [Bacillus sp. KH172YL63]|uniref:DUF4083 domain-containing protein n=1 Tax=Bacillus sp. KH172YL63 TaxID=2709784 RepID=UPI0013E4FF9F|nr:DUF4083 domain-containing protein [Bacillus sp. KH172YL63]BCB03966.1 hypothetical protein KH172YL63_20990 [Bacillus sp. KH172YL63]
MDIVFLIVVFSLLALSVVSFTLFIRRLVIGSKVSQMNHHASEEMNKKLDRIIELLEEKRPGS